MGQPVWKTDKRLDVLVLLRKRLALAERNHEQFGQRRPNATRRACQAYPIGAQANLHYGTAQPICKGPAPQNPGHRPAQEAVPEGGVESRQPAAARVLTALRDKLRSASARGRRGHLAVVRTIIEQGGA